MPDDGDLIEVVHSGAAEMAVGDRESGRLDNMGLDAQAGAQAQNRPGVLRDVRLEKDDAHRTAAFGPGGKVEEKSQRRAHLTTLMPRMQEQMEKLFRNLRLESGLQDQPLLAQAVASSDSLISITQ